MFRIVLFSIAGAGLVVIAGYGVYKCVQYCTNKRAKAEPHIEEEKYIPPPPRHYQ